jgi:pentatricopeptide repeat protein
MPIYSNLYSNLARQGLTKTFTHGYAQSVVAATHPASYPNQHHRTPFSRRPSRLGKLGTYQFQNAFHNSTSPASIAVTHECRQDRTVGNDSGLEAYFDAWKKQHAAGEPEKEWTQFQFAKRIEWKPVLSVVELKGKEKEKKDVDTRPKDLGRGLERSYSTSALDDLKNSHEVIAESVTPENVGDVVSQEVESISSEQASAISRAPTPIAPVQSPALTLDTNFARSPESSATSTSTTFDLQSQSYAEHLTKLSATSRYAEIPAVFEAMLVAGIRPIAPAYNALLVAAIHLPTERIQIVPKALDVYSDMLRRKVTPNTATYDILVSLLASRSIEVSSLKKSLEEKRTRFGGMEEAGKFMFASNEMEYAILSEDDRLDLAIKLFDTSLTVQKDRSYPAETYFKLILACAEAARVPDMVRLYEHMELSKIVPLAATFPPMIQGFAKAGDLISAVECYNEYKALAISHDNGELEIADRQDGAVYAAIVKAYIESDKLEGAIKFYKKIVTEYGPQSASLRSEIIAGGFVQGMIERGNLPEAMGWTEGLDPSSKAMAMGKIATVAADRGDRLTAVSAFANIPPDFDSIATPAMALMATSVREGDVAAASQYWQILSSPNMAVTSAFIEPTAMYAVALMGSGQVAEGLTQADQMFLRIKDSTTETKSSISDEVDEGIQFLSRFMTERGITDPRTATEAPPVYQPDAFTPTSPYSNSAATSFEDTFDPYAALTDFKGSALIADELERGNSGRNKVSRLNEALARFRNIRRAGRHPRYITYAKLISAAAREDRMQLAQDILGMARTDIPLLNQYSVVRYGWVSILDAMVGACLTLGNRGLAAQYHQELLDMGAAPTANTFGLYITTLKESTKTFDEASEAVKIFHRAKSEGVEPSSFLYNALIGKLGKARRIDDCLYYFAEMRALGIRPTSVTYGTIVNALCRVSDEKFAEELFEEMESMPNYKARPAPYNSLMQFFLTTKRDKSKVLAYYERMKSNGIEPTNHTYKLLIDAHATLEPVNMAAAETILDIIRGTGQKPEAVHYSSLIHAKGCVLHDVDGARVIFDSVLADPSIRPQACLYQALFEAMVANHRVSETEPILKDMSLKRVEMTPYIANTLIHGWANEMNIEKSKEIFASVGQDKREPSTYEAMTRAYLTVEDRQSAKAVVQEMLGRGYPSAVSGKIFELVGGSNFETL